MKEIGAALGYTESRISQIHTKAVLKLKTKLARKLKADDLPGFVPQSELKPLQPKKCSSPASIRDEVGSGPSREGLVDGAEKKRAGRGSEGEG